MPAPSTQPAEHARRTAAILQALAEGCAPPSVHPRHNAKRAKVRALEILRETTLMGASAWDSYLQDWPFPWPEPGQKPKLTKQWLAERGLAAPATRAPVVMEGLPEILPQEPPDAIMQRRVDAKIAEYKRRANEAEARAIEAEDAMRLALDLGRATLHPPTWQIMPDAQHGQPGVPCLSLNDWHLGEVVSIKEMDGINEFNLDIAAGRIQRVVQRTLDLCFEHTRGPGGARPEYPGIVVFANGDMISGDIHDELRETNEVSRNQSMLMAAEHLTAAVTILADYFGRVHVCCAPGNHGRDGKPRAKLVCFENGDWLTYKMAERYCAKDQRITWDIPESGDWRVTVAGLRLMGTHGDRLGVKGGDGIIGVAGPILRGSVKVGRQQSVIGRHFDTLVIGHYHTDFPLRQVMGGNCLIGPNEYSTSVLRAAPSPPSQMLFFVHPAWGITSRWEIFCDEKGRKSFADTPCLTS
jgi:hypothetical protein